jgi:urease accessory protein
MRGEGPFIFARATDGFNLDAIIDHIHMAKVQALAAVREDRR